MYPSYVWLLGSPEVQAGSQRFRLTPERPHQLLAYLAYNGDRISRQHLAFLFWPDQPDESSRRNLRKIVLRARRLHWLQDRPLRTDAGGLCWTVATDVADFQQAVADKRWQDALSLYRGALLEGMDDGAGAEFIDWLRMEREQVREQWRDVLWNRARELEELGRLGEAAATLRPLLARDELSEDALHACMRMLVREGRLDDAVRRYEGFASLLHEEVGLAPSPRVLSLVEEIRSNRSIVGAPEPVASAVSRPQGLDPGPLPPRPISFVGRASEVREVTQLLNQQDCRLLTLIGPGGSGKTTLAVMAADWFRERYADGAHFVALEEVEKPDQIASQIAASLGISLRDAGEPLAAVRGYLRNKQLLLVLDGFEHLARGAAVVSELMKGCPGVRLIVTSRQRLQVPEEWLFPVEGLSFPEDKPNNAGDALAYDAVRLFEERARQVRPRFRVTDADAGPVAELCRLLDGQPLGIELAAAWARIMSCAEIVQEVQRSLDFLADPRRSVNARHRSLRATFEHSWRLLTRKEQDALQRLSVFEGTFDRSAAIFVASTTFPLLTSLMDKSLLRSEASGRLRFHALIRQFTLGKLRRRPKASADALNSIVAYYADFLHRRERDLYGDRQAEAIWEIAQEMANIRVAWQRSIEQRNLAALDRMTMSLSIYVGLPGSAREGEELFRAASQRFRRPSVTLGMLLTNYAYFVLILADPDRAIKIGERSLNILRRCRGHATVKGIAYLHLGYAQYVAADVRRAAASLRLSARLLEAVNPFVATFAHVLLVYAYSRLGGGYKAAALHYHRAASLAKQTNNRWGVAEALLSYAALLVRQQRWPEAESALRQSLDVAREFGKTQFVAEVLAELGGLHAARGRADEAEAALNESLSTYDVTWSFKSYRALRAQASVAVARGAYPYAIMRLHEALGLAIDGRQRLESLDIVLDMAEVERAMGASERALELVLFAIANARSAADIRRRARRLLTVLDQTIPRQTVAATRRRVSRWRWNDLKPFSPAA